MINLSNLFNPLPFELKSKEIEVINKMENEIIYSTWTLDGKMQDKGRKTEQLVSDILYLFDDIKVLKSEKSSVLDEVFKIDFIVETLSDPLDVFAFQVKSSMTGAMEHHLKYGEQIVWKESCVRTPWVLVVDGSLSNFEMFDAIANELCILYSLNFDKLSEICAQILASNSRRIFQNSVGSLNKKEVTALRLFYKIGVYKNTYYLI